MSVKSRSVDRGWGWIVLLASYIGTSITSLIYVSGIYNLLFLEAFGHSQALTALCLSVHSCLHALVAPLASMMISSFGARTTLVFGTIITMLGYFLCAFATNLFMVFVTYGLLSGCGFGFTFMPGFAVINSYFIKYRNIAFGIVSTGFGMGAFVLAPMLNYIIEEYGWQGSMIITSGIVAHFFIVAVILIPVEPPKEDSLEIRVKPESVNGLSEGKYLMTAENGGNDENMILMVQNKGDGTFLQTDAENGSIGKCDNSNYINSHKEKCLKKERAMNGVNNANNKGVPNGSMQYSEKWKNFKTTQTQSQPNISLLGIGRKQEMKSMQQNGPTFYRSEANLPNNRLFSDDRTFCTMSDNHSYYPEKIATKVSNSQDRFKTETTLEKLRVKASCCPSNMSSWKPLIETKFILLSFNLFFICMGLSIMYIHYPAFAASKGASLREVTYILSVIGISNMCSRLLTGVATTPDGIDMYLVYMSTCGITGVVVFITPFIAHTFTTQIFMAFLFGIYANCFTSLMMPIAIEYVGFDASVNAFSVMEAVCGLAFFLGSPIAGFLFDITGSYAHTIFFAGINYFIGTIFVMVIPMLERKKQMEENSPTFEKSCNEEKVLMKTEKL